MIPVSTSAESVKRVVYSALITHVLLAAIVLFSSLSVIKEVRASAEEIQCRAPANAAVTAAFGEMVADFMERRESEYAEDIAAFRIAVGDQYAALKTC